MKYSVDCPNCGGKEVITLELAEPAETPEPKLKGRLPEKFREHVPAPMMEDPLFIDTSKDGELLVTDEDREVYPVAGASIYKDLMSGPFQKYKGGRRQLRPDFLYTIVLKMRYWNDFIKMVGSSFSGNIFELKILARQKEGYSQAICWYSGGKVVAHDAKTQMVVLKTSDYNQLVEGAPLKLYSVTPDGERQYEVRASKPGDIALKAGGPDFEVCHVRYYEVYRNLHLQTHSCGESVSDALRMPLTTSPPTYDIVIGLYKNDDFIQVINALEKGYRLVLWDMTSPPHKALILEEFLQCKVIDSDAFGRILLRSPKRCPM